MKVCKITSPHLTQLSVDNKTYVQIAANGINVIYEKKTNDAPQNQVMLII